jgi:hypothetical protein
MNNEYVAKYAKWRKGVMPHDAKVIVRQSTMDNVDPEPLLLKYYQENVQSKPFSITDCPGYEGIIPPNLGHEVCKHCGSIEYYH